MSLKDLLALTGVPGLELGVSILTATYATLENISVYKQQYLDLSGRCVSLLLALRDSSKNVGDERVVELADEIEAIIRRIHRKANDYANLGRLKSFLQQREIKDGIDSLHRDIDAAMMNFHIHIGMRLTRGQIESRAIQERDRAELREQLQKIVKSQDDMRVLLNMQSSRPVEEIMESLQTELMDPTLQPNQEETFRQSLWLLHEKTSKLPPLTDLRGQITFNNRVVAKGFYNDVYAGEWLDKEKVALRLPRTLANTPDAQKHFQHEVTIWRKLNHPNVVRLYGIFYISEDICSVSPWMDNDTSINYVRNNLGVDRLKLLSEVASGLDYLHSNSIVHGDLRGANVLISKEGTACLSDFGMSKFLEDCGQDMTSSPGVNPRWFAPELFKKNGQLSTHSDIWSFGMVCLELISGTQPFCDIPRDVTVLNEIVNGKTPHHPGSFATAAGLTKAMWQLLNSCWNKNPPARPSIASIKTKLLEIRGQVTSSAPSKSRSLLSFRRSTSRPSTADSQNSSKSSPASLSPISLNGMNGPLKLFGTRKDRRSPSEGQLGIIVEPPTSIMNRNDPGPPQLDLYHLSPAAASAQRNLSFDNYPSPIRSIISSDSGVHLSAPLRDAVTSFKSIVNVTRSGDVISGTLEGLVDRMINNFNLKRDLEFRKMFLASSADFTTHEDLFGIIERKFFEAELDTDKHLENRVALQYNILLVLKYWLSCDRLHVDQQLLWQMKNFCESAKHKKSSILMVDKINDLLSLIKERPMKDLSGSPLILSPSGQLPQNFDITPQGLAIALSLLEGGIYKRINWSDYFAHLGRHPGHNNVEVAYQLNNKIVLWVKQSVLHYDSVEGRADVIKFFINTAQECRRLRNFSSLTAIAIGLHSTIVERLKRTKAELLPMLKRRLCDLEDLLNPRSNHRSYREALKQVPDPEYKDNCIPWLAVHLRELHMVLQQNPIIIHSQGQPLINFQRYVRFIDRAREALHFMPPNLEQYRHLGQLAYLEYQLRGVQPSSQADDELMERSLALEALEAQDNEFKRPLTYLGFDTTLRKI